MLKKVSYFIKQHTQGAHKQEEKDSHSDSHILLTKSASLAIESACMTKEYWEQMPALQRASTVPSLNQDSWQRESWRHSCKLRDTRWALRRVMKIKASLTIEILYLEFDDTCLQYCEICIVLKSARLCLCKQHRRSSPSNHLKRNCGRY